MSVSVSLMCSCVFYQYIKYVQPILRNGLKCAIRLFSLRLREVLRMEIMTGIIACNSFSFLVNTQADLV